MRSRVAGSRPTIRRFPGQLDQEATGCGFPVRLVVEGKGSPLPQEVSGAGQAGTAEGERGRRDAELSRQMIGLDARPKGEIDVEAEAPFVLERRGDDDADEEEPTRRVLGLERARYRLSSRSGLRMSQEQGDEGAAQARLRRARQIQQERGERRIDRTGVGRRPPLPGRRRSPHPEAGALSIQL